ncbi:hypothetical protein GCM10027578_26800 [Spirosoma luteolum]
MHFRPLLSRSGLVILLGLTVFFDGWAQVGFQASPVRLYFEQHKPGDQTQVVHITNTEPRRLVLQAGCADWRRDSTGNKQFFPAGTLPASCCAMVQVSPSVIELGPGEKKDVLVTMRPTPDATRQGIRHGMLLLTQINEREGMGPNATSQVVIRGEIGIHLYLTPAESAGPDIAIADMSVLTRGKEQQLVVLVQNKGGTLLESNLRLEYLNQDTMQEVKAAPVPVNTMPNDAIRVSAVVPATLPKGNYLVVAILDSGPSLPLKVAELETTLK